VKNTSQQDWERKVRAKTRGVNMDWMEEEKQRVAPQFMTSSFNVVHDHDQDQLLPSSTVYTMSSALASGQ